MKIATQHISVPRDGETDNGDAVVIRSEAEISLLAVIDGLGHGQGAALVAQTATNVLADVPLTDGVERVIHRLHETLKGTRGAAALVCLIRPSRTGSSDGLYELEGCSIGNVEMRCRVSSLAIVLTPGVLGGRIDRIRLFGGPLLDDERLAIFSDGISPRFSLRDLTSLSPIDACQTIFERHRRSHDDATILVADMVNGELT
jgi:negative regulator of sigma-B (phosphoserine phosphatase)